MFISSHKINTKYMNELNIKRIYLPYNEDDGFRILIDRLWPRGISKVNASINEHCKYIAPSTEIRKAFGHKEEEYKTFAENYRKELNDNKDAMRFVEHCKKLLNEDNVTLLYGAKNETCNHAIILHDWIMTQIK